MINYFMKKTFRIIFVLTLTAVFSCSADNDLKKTAKARAAQDRLNASQRDAQSINQDVDKSN